VDGHGRGDCARAARCFSVRREDRAVPPAYTEGSRRASTDVSRVVRSPPTTSSTVTR
jgi:hypothetical protein